MTHRILPLVLLAACGPELDTSNTQAPPPPYDFDLAVYPMVQGTDVPFLIDGAPPSSTVQLRFGRNLGLSCPPALGGRCLDIEAPARPFRTVTVDASGVGSTVPFLPASVPPGGTYYFQALVRSGAGSWQISSPVQGRILRDSQLQQRTALSQATPTGLASLDYSLSSNLGYDAASLSNVEATFTDHNTGAILMSGVALDLGGGDATFEVALPELDLATTNPRTMDVDITWEVNGIMVDQAIQWTVGITPDRVALIWQSGTLYVKSREGIAPRAGASIYFGFSNFYRDVANLGGGLYEMEGSTSQPALPELNLAYFSQGNDRFVTSFNEALVSSYGGVSTGPVWSTVNGTGSGFEVTFFYATDPDVDGDGDSDLDDLMALDLDTL